MSIITENAAQLQGVDGEELLWDEPAQRAFVSVIRNAAGPATKVFSVDRNGKLIKNSAAQIWEGVAQREPVADLDEFIRLRTALRSNEALCYGTPSCTPARIVTQASLIGAGNEIARDREHFSFPRGAPGIFMGDHDRREGHPALTYDQLDAILVGAVPELARVQRVYCPSSSAFIFRRTTGEELIGNGGIRFYFMVQNAADIPGLMDLIYQKLWEAGHGYIFVSKSGALLDRSLIDVSVAQPERLDFAAQPVLQGDLERRAFEPVFIDGEPMLDASQLHPDQTLAEWRGESKMLTEAREKASPESRRRRRDWVDERLSDYKARNPKIPFKRLRKVLETAAKGNTVHFLPGDFELRLADGSRTTVAQLLADPDRYDGQRMPDPLEPDYRGDNRIALAQLRPELGDDPMIYSHAHGGINYRLVRETAELEDITGKRPALVDGTLEVIRARSDLYERGDVLVRVRSGERMTFASDRWLADYIPRCVKLWKFAKSKGGLVRVPSDVPDWLAPTINAKVGEWGVKRLNGIITAPTLRPDGSLLTTPGYNEETGLLLRPGVYPEIPTNPTTDQLNAAFLTLWKPFSLFPYETDSDRGAMLSAVLTALVRRTLDYAPGFVWDAAQAGEGKTLQAQCIMRLSGNAPVATAAPDKSEEMNKVLTAVLLEGQAAILFDNLRGDLVSKELEIILTNPTYTGRILGLSRMGTFPTDVLFLFTGNNFTPGGDLWRRLVSIRINAQDENPERRAFPFHPLAVCTEQRQAIVAAGLTLLRGFISAGMPRIAQDGVATFERWNRLIRQCVLWLADQKIACSFTNDLDLQTFGDPLECQKRMKENTPGQQKLGAFLGAVTACYGGKMWTVAELMDVATDVSVSDEEARARLLTVLNDIAGERGKGINSRRLGRWIERDAGVHLDGMWLVEKGYTRDKVRLWTVQQPKTN